MYWAFLVSAVVVAYLSGSINFAIIVSRLTGRIDIRQVGTKNPGTANIGRNLGKGWGAVVFLGDIGKAIVPMAIAEEIAFSLSRLDGTIGLVLMGMAVVLGHRKPIYFGFRGGGGLATTIGVMAFFAPLEALVSMLAGFGLGMFIFRNKELKLGRWVAMLIILITPVAALIFTAVMDIHIVGRIGIGVLEWHVVAGLGVLAVYIVVSNIGGVIDTVRGKVDHSENP